VHINSPKQWLIASPQFESEQEVIDVLNMQTQLLFDWKRHLVELITQKLIEDVQEGDEMTPYERALEVQQECEAFLQAYQSLLVCVNSCFL
jgi:E3 ubiquitin-protein ligase SHPRH